jgi:hypothetical protein
MKRYIILAAKLCFAFGLLYYLISSKRLDFAKLSGIRDWSWIVLAQIAVLGLLLLTFLRWHLLLRGQGIRYRIRETVSIGFIGFFFSQFAPGATGGDLVKAFYVAIEHPERRAQGITTVILDRVVGLLVLVAIGAGAMALQRRWIRSDPELSWLADVVLWLLGAALVGALLFFNERVRRLAWVRRFLAVLPFRDTLHRVQAAIYAYKRRPGTVAVSLLISAAVHGLLILSCFAYARSLGGPGLEARWFFVLVPLAHLTMALPLSPGGLGVGEWAFVELFERAGYPDGDAIAVLQRLSWYLWALVGLGFYLAKRRRSPQRPPPAASFEEIGAGEACAAAPESPVQRGSHPPRLQETS